MLFREADDQSCPLPSARLCFPCFLCKFAAGGPGQIVAVICLQASEQQIQTPKTGKGAVRMEGLPVRKDRDRAVHADYFGYPAILAIGSEKSIDTGLGGSSGGTASI